MYFSRFGCVTKARRIPTGINFDQIVSLIKDLKAWVSVSTGMQTSVISIVLL